MRSPNWLFLVLLLLLAGLQYRLWVGNGSLAQVADLTQQIADQHAENEAVSYTHLTLPTILLV